MIASRITHNLDLAAREARKVENGSLYFFGSVLSRNGRVINVGANYPNKTHTKSNHPFRRIHAELSVILGVSDYDLVDSTMYVARVGFYRRSKRAFAKPCQYCQAMIMRTGIKSVYYTIDDRSIGHWNVRNNAWEILSAV